MWPVGRETMWPGGEGENVARCEGRRCDPVGKETMWPGGEGEDVTR